MDIDAVYGCNQTLVGATKSTRFYKTWQAASTGCSCSYKYSSTSSHPVFKVGANPATTQQPYTVPQALDAVLHFWSGILPPDDDHDDDDARA